MTFPFRRGDLVRCVARGIWERDLTEGHIYYVLKTYPRENRIKVIADRGMDINPDADRFVKAGPGAVDKIPPGNREQASRYVPGERQAVPQVAPMATQVGGSHYTDMPIQPLDYIMANGIPFPEGNVIKYVSRWRKKGGIQDLKKARDMLDKLIAFEEKKGAPVA
ncbi:DUF3310 domain-containing protein [Inquilinus limosus]|uniref:DUF3310 domain-containing protein n=1 Tax=Inquilinus limosus TaxID=171674 RepID=UPI001FE0EA63|nr:DUF3310 domain-containing protein [Inquilinus limosus]